MTTKRIRKPKQNKVERFPCLFESKLSAARCIVLFTQDNKGVVVYSDSVEGGMTSGEYRDDWVSCLDQKTWVKFDGEIKLSN